MEMPMLKDMVIILGSSLLIILIFQRIRIPSILGFLITGMIVGPYGLSLIDASHEVELMAEIGIIFLLFVIGIEFSLKSLATIKKTVLLGGLIQVGGTILVSGLVTYLSGLTWNQSVFIGFLISLSSTAIVLKLLQGKGEITAPHGRIALAILIFQDIIVVPMMLVTPLLAGEADNLTVTLLILLAKVIGVVGLVLLLARYIVPYTLHLVTKTRSNELFILAIILICFATAWFTSALGLSLALGAFFAGLIISESEYNHQATANILPFREIFISFFFVSIGMLLDLSFFINHFIVVLLLTLLVMIMKGTIVAATALMLGYPSRSQWLAGFSLFQVGEFAFILAAVGMSYNLITIDIYQYFLAVSLLSMAATPFMFQYSHKLTDFFIRIPIPGQVKRRLKAMNKVHKMKETHSETQWDDHLVIIGYGLNGRNLVKAAKKADIPFVIVELNPDTVKEINRQGDPVIYGDATQETILQHVQVHLARIVVIAISDPVATKKIVNLVRRISQTTYLIVRTRYIKDIEDILKLGADEIIPEEFETSIKIFSRVLHKYLVPMDEIQSFINHIRAQNYELLRSPTSGPDKTGRILHIPDIEIATLPVQQGKNVVVGKQIKESGLREKYGVTILAINRQGKFIKEINGEEILKQDDVLYVAGNPDQINELNKQLKVQ
ncbi:MAG: cation:proton antiporter [Cyclobacteriaceae bacterium]|nr:cation:proton antiporter [Cyclobacteriaceae bacterium]